MSLFPLEPLPDAEPPETISAERRRTLKRQAELARGVHPRTKLPLANNGHACGDCAHHFERRMGSTYHKCDHGYPAEPVEFHGTMYSPRSLVSHGPATDVRVSWPACSGWKPEK